MVFEFHAATVPLKEFVNLIVEAAAPARAAPQAPELDLETIETSALIENFCQYYTNLMEYRVEQIELKLKTQTAILERKLSATVSELESTKASLEKVKDIAKNRVTQLATEVAELTMQLNKEKEIEAEITVERDELRRKLEELRKLPTGPVKLMPTGEPDASPRSVPVATLPRAMSNTAIPSPRKQAPPRELPRTKSVFVRRELGELEQLMAELVSPICPVCKQAVIDNPIQAFGKNYHPEHFCCSSCSTELAPGDAFNETDDFRILCGDCLAIERAPHCSKCRRVLGSGEAVTIDDAKSSYCADCAAEITEGMVLICKSCKGPVEGDCINTLNAKWHPSCFVCPSCSVDLTSGNFYDVGGFPYCELHGH